MKKLLLVIASLFVYTIGSYAQSATYTVFSSKVAQLNTYTNTWEWSHSYDVNMSVVVTDTKIYVDDENKSIYTITSNSATTKLNYDSKVITYKAIDERNKRCSIELVSWINKDFAPQMYIVYSDIRFAYSLISK